VARLARARDARPRCVRTAGLVLGCAWLLAPGPVHADAEIAAEVVASGLDRPLFATSPAGDGRLFVVERAGRVRILLGGAVLSRPFLDITPLVSTRGERGLLGLAFDPAYAWNGLFYVYYTNRAGSSVLARFRVGDDPDLADAASREILLVVPQPFANHNGGTIAFGADGYLYWGLGDGGLANDPFESAQDPQSLLGKMLRLDVSGGAGSPAAIPADNPFVGDPGVRDEIWSFGLRNPYRWSFDRETGDMWIGDVGQARREEVDFEPAGAGGRNYGWDVMEGTLCNATDPAPAPPCFDPSLTLPVLTYPHSQGRCSVTGGFVYRGRVPGIRGLYFFGDYCTGRIFSYDPQSATSRERSAELRPPIDGLFRLVGFGEDGSGELYVVHQTGSVFRIRSPLPACSDGFDNDGDGLSDADDPACVDPDQDGELPRNDLRVDVRPRALNPGSRGVVPVSLFASQRYDLRLADPSTLAFGPASAPLAHAHGPHPEDVDGDGLPDWTLHFRTQAAGLGEGDSQACVRVEIQRIPYEGCDAVTLPPGSAGGAAAQAAGRAAEARDTAPAIPRYVEPEPGCRLWHDCGWIRAPAASLASADLQPLAPLLPAPAASVPGLGPPGLLVAGLALLGVGDTRLRR
jgi:glucose/arabinose dehydrogenase